MEKNKFMSYFVVTYNHKTGKFAVDSDTADAKFDRDLIYDFAKNEWVDMSNPKNFTILKADKAAEEQLIHLLEKRKTNE